MKYYGGFSLLCYLFVSSPSNRPLSSAARGFVDFRELNLVKQIAQHMRRELPPLPLVYYLEVGSRPGATGSIWEGRVSFSANSLKFMFINKLNNSRVIYHLISLM
jgi:hypothetical protein